MSKRRDSMPAVPAIVLGSGVTALGVTRILSRENIPVYNLSSQRDFASSSRWWRSLSSSTDKFPEPSQLAELLDPLPLERAVLFPCSDAWLRAVSQLDRRLADRFLSTATFDRYDLLTDKGCFAAAVKACRVPHPRTISLQTREDLDELRESDFRGAFLKPRNSQRFSSHFGVKGFAVDTRAEALQQFDRVTRAGFDVVLQEFIPGPPGNHYFIDGFVDRHGRTCGMFGRRRVRMDPPTLGNSTCTVSVALTDVAPAVEAVQQVIRSIKLRGIFSAEFKVDDRDGQWKIIEINARPWWYVGFAATCGVNVCAMAYRDALGLPVEPVSHYPAGQRCTYINQDWRSCRQLHRDGQLSLPDWVGSWLGSTYMVLAWDDPVPGVQHLSDAAFRYLRKHVARAQTASFPLADYRPVERRGSTTGAPVLRAGRL